MVGTRLVLAVLAFVGWTGTIVSQLIVAQTADETERIEWSERRDQFLLLSSLSTNSLVLSSVYRFYRRRRRKSQDQ